MKSKNNTKLESNTESKVFYCYTLDGVYEVVLAEDFRKLKRELEDAEIELKSKETCSQCGHGWNPSLVESGWCIFCIQEETRCKLDAERKFVEDLKKSLEDRDSLIEELKEINKYNRKCKI